MPYNQLAKLELLNALNCINTEEDLLEFRDLVANFFCTKGTKDWHLVGNGRR